jgi:hypothetical protein
VVAPRVTLAPTIGVVGASGQAWAPGD